MNIRDILSNSQTDGSYAELYDIVYNKNIHPTIVNPTSKFVVVTYWWGSGVKNKNTARPCLDFYEALITKPFDSVVRMNNIDPSKLETWSDKKWLKMMTKVPEIKDFYYKRAVKYTRERLEATGVKYTNTNESHVHMVNEYEKIMLHIIAKAYVENKSIIKELHIIYYKQSEIRKQYENISQENNVSNIKHQLQTIIVEYNNLHAELKMKLRPFLQELETALMYRLPLTYDEMIRNWEKQCERVGCNYMAIEYPEFTRSGGYQLAINAKPLFIQKALDSCDGRAVVYIDGDMTMNFYPALFDMDDIDYMARGWHIDPRASWKHTQSIIVDPYLFETSGGIMYFSSSYESQMLLKKWIKESAKKSQKGKADDRIISLIFNTNRLLAPMKIMQLPIEYLWLSMDYDYSIDDEIVDRSRIYVEHPACLTSEDTATASGASSSRAPKFYNGIGEVFPRSEALYEYAMFPSKDMADQMRPWLDYMNTATYFKDVTLYNEDLENEQPFYVVPYDEKFREKNTIIESNVNAANTLVPTIPTMNSKYNAIIITTLNLPQILRAFVDHVNVIYMPTSATNEFVSSFYKVLDSDAGKRLELIFVDKNLMVGPSHIFEYIMRTDQPIYFSANNPLLQTLLAMVTDTDSLETILKNNYQFLSRIRVHILKPMRRGMYGGGDNSSDRNTNTALEVLYNFVGGRKIQTRHRPKVRGRRISRRR